MTTFSLYKITWYRTRLSTGWLQCSQHTSTMLKLDISLHSSVFLTGSWCVTFSICYSLSKKLRDFAEVSRSLHLPHALLQLKCGLIYTGLLISRITHNKIVRALCEVLPTQHHLILTLKSGQSCIWEKVWTTKQARTGRRGNQQGTWPIKGFEPLLRVRILFSIHYKFTISSNS